MSTTPTRVLVVEDSRTQAEELQYILSAGGFDVDVAPSGEAALGRVEGTAFDVIVSDIVMPGISGYELCRRLKHDPRWRGRPVLLLTSLTDPIDVVHALECGADGFLTKPCEPEHLIGRVNALLEGRRLRATAGSDAIPVLFRGEQFTVEAGKAQILDLLLSTFEDAARKNDDLAAARDALASKHEELVQIERQKEELSALVVHDLKSPAAGIMMAAQAQLRRAQLSDADRTLWGLVFASAQVINRMVLNLLDIASSADGVFAARPVTVDVPTLVQSVQHLMTPLADSLGQRIEVQVPPGLPSVPADPELLRRVLQNLLDNALRHSPRGSPVQLDAQHTAEGVVFRVYDRGPGVPAGMRDRIFDKYVRLPGQQPGGTSLGKGLGLAFSRIAVEAHGGRIWVEDNVPTGSVFAVLIPAASPSGA